MILNGLGFVSAPLYMFSNFFENRACEHLIGEGVKPEYLNDDKLGRTMDKLFSKGLSNVFLAISLNAFKTFDVSLLSEHLDSSSFHLHGEYKNNQNKNDLNKTEIVENSEPQEIEITYGYSRDLQFPQKNGAALNIENTPIQRYHACNKAAPFFKVPSRTIDQI